MKFIPWIDCQCDECTRSIQADQDVFDPHSGSVWIDLLYHDYNEEIQRLNAKEIKELRETTS